VQGSDLRVCFDEDPQPADIDVLRDALSASNVAAVGVDDYRPLALFLRDASDAIVGGLSGATYWGWLHVELLWVREDLRGQSHGGRLLALAEQEAVRRGCRHARLSTFDFQAPAFYLTRGYEVVGTLPDFPPDHRKDYMVKTLAADSAPTHGVSSRKTRTASSCHSDELAGGISAPEEIRRR
jgi:GNAT superfamily N-acetyltransferase